MRILATVRGSGVRGSGFTRGCDGFRNEEFQV